MNYSTFDKRENVRNISTATTLSMESRTNIIYFHSGWRTVWLIRSYISHTFTYIIPFNAQYSIWWFMISVFALNFSNYFFFFLVLIFHSPFVCYYVAAVIVKVICLLYSSDDDDLFNNNLLYIIEWTFQFWFKFLDQILLIDVILRLWRTNTICIMINWDFNASGLPFFASRTRQLCVWFQTKYHKTF